MIANEEKKWHGFWYASDDEEIELPKVQNWIDESWQPEDKAKLLSYVCNAANVVASSSMKTQCLLCSEQLCSSNFQSDGEWLWPEDLAHYMKVHDVKLPDSFVEHIRGRQYQYPSVVEKSLEELPWPE